MRQYHKVTIYLFIIFSVQVHYTYAGVEKQLNEKGRLTDTVRCKTNSNITYALYLPVNYSEKVKWPVIFVFDPSARGKLAVSGFVQAAEKFGMIIIGSNNSRNQLPSNELSVVINSMFTDVKDRFSIDSRRIYTSGFSGGSRVASMIALDNGIISGVIACGAGFPNNADFNNISSFSYYGLVGNHDMNYLEMCDLDKNLNRFGKTVELRIFNGGHMWPSPDLLQEAVEWMELQAMNKGIIYKNPAFIYALFEKYNNTAALLLKQEKLIMAAQRYEYIIKDFPDYDPAQKIKLRIDSIKKSGGYNKALRLRDKSRSWELEMQNSLISNLINQAKNETLTDSIRNKIAGQLRILKNLEAGKDTNNQAMASRVLMLLNSVCFETGRNCLKIKKYKAAAICYRVQALVDTENNVVQFMLSKCYALDNDPGNSIKALEKAISLGYNNKQLIERDSAFISLKNQKRFREAMMKLK